MAKRSSAAAKIMRHPEHYSLSVLRRLEAESIHILREVVSECERPVMMYSVGKDSSAMVRLAQKAFHPGRIPFPLLHIDTSYKFPEMYEFRDEFCKRIEVELRVYRNAEALANNANPWDLGTVKCCALLKTQGLLSGLRLGEHER
jgi:sulfate adenylyltransferase subunit 2